MSRHLSPWRVVLLLGIVLRVPSATAVESRPETAGEAPPVTVLVRPLAPRSIQGDQQLPIAYTAALQLAVAKNLDIMQARARLQEDEGERRRVIGLLLPWVSAGLTVGHIDGEIQGSFGDLERREFSTINPAGRVSVLINPGQALFDVLAASKRADASQFASEGATQETLARVAAEYFGLQRAAAQIDIASSAVATATELRRLARDREALGVGLEVDVARAEARLAREEVTLTIAEERFRTASTGLAETLQLDPAVVLVPVETEVRQLTLADAQRPLAELLDRALSRRPEVQEVGLRFDAAADTRAASWWKALGPTTYGAFEESGIGRNFDVGNRQIYAGFIGWTLTPASIGETQAAAARVAQAQLRRDQLAQAVKAEVVRARDLVITAQQRAAAGRRGVAAAEQSLALSQDRFENGAGLELEVIEAQEALTTARTAFVDAILDFNTAQVRLMRAVGEVSLSSLVESVAGFERAGSDVNAVPVTH